MAGPAIEDRYESIHAEGTVFAESPLSSVYADIHSSAAREERVQFNFSIVVDVTINVPVSFMASWPVGMRVMAHPDRVGRRFDFERFHCPRKNLAPRPFVVIAIDQDYLFDIDPHTVLLRVFVTEVAGDDESILATNVNVEHVD